jgi:filamentous hemagglutinin family protein
MIIKSWFGRGLEWKIGGCVALVAVLSIGVSDRVLAQIVPDKTLGAEGSVVTPNVDIRGIQGDRIDGGATRGANLFHSFQEFNVGQGRGAYFGNPTGIENILTRVTGSNPSNILGRLGVLGGANLFLLNPNGIIFGANASLDIKGSFVATTGDRVQLGDSGYFSASQPQTSSLLSVSPGALFFSQVANQPTAIINQGNLSTGKHLTLSAGNLDLQGQLKALGDLTLQAQDTVKVRDSAAIPFIASAGQNLLVQGNLGVDIFAFSHPESGLFSGGDMVLRSTNTVEGDAHYWSGGNFRIEKLDGSLGNLFSSRNPIIRARGDVFINTYQGRSMHILAEGKVEIPGYVWIQGADPENGLVETVNLADETTVSINGKSEPTLDIRAGVNPDVIGEPILTLTGTFLQPANFTPNPSSADIKIGTILFALPKPNNSLVPLAGRVLLTNQYQPNSSLSGDIQVTDTQRGRWGAISMDGGAGNPSVAINSRGAIALDGTVKTSSFGDGGAIRLEANGNITTQTLNASTVFGSAGDISLISRNGAINTTDKLYASTRFFDGGRITLQAKGDINISDIRSNGGINGGSGNITLTSDTGKVSVTDGFLLSRTYGPNKGGDINITAVAVSIDKAVVDASTYGQADSGRVTITASDTVSVAGSSVRSLVGGMGDSSGITINTGSLSVSEFSELNSSVIDGGEGRAGDIVINARDIVTFDGGFARSRLETRGVGRAGDIYITTGSLLLTGIPSDFADRNAGQLVAATFGKGDAGNVTINARDRVTLDGRGSDIYSLVGINRILGNGGVGNGGDINITSGSLSAINGARVIADTEFQGNAGNITLNTGNLLIANGSTISAIADRSDGSLFKAGDIKITVHSTLQADNGKIETSSNQSSGGDITIKAGDIRLFGNSDITTRVNEGTGGGGDIELTADSIVAFDDSDILAYADDDGGKGGNITLDTPAFIGENYSPASSRNDPPNTLDRNNRVDINATGAFNGVITLPDVSFIQNILTELPENQINTDSLLANSCIVRRNQPMKGSFTITGTGGLPQRPGDAQMSSFPTVDVKTLPTDSTLSNTNPNPSWQKSDPIIEPQGIYRLPNGKLVLSRECS